MNISKKFLDRRNSKDWKTVQSIPIPKSFHFTAEKEIKIIEPLKFPKNFNPDIKSINMEEAQSSSSSKKESSEKLKPSKDSPQKRIQPEKAQGPLQKLSEEGSQILHLKGQIEDLRAKHKKENHQLKLQYEAQLLLLKDQHKRTLVQLKDKHKQTLDKIKLQHNFSIKEAQRPVKSGFNIEKQVSFKKLLSLLRTKMAHSQPSSDLKNNSPVLHSELVEKEWQEKYDKLKNKYQEKLKLLKDRYQTGLNLNQFELGRKLEQVKKDIRKDEKHSYKNKIQEIKDHYECQFLKLKKEKEKKQEDLENQYRLQIAEIKKSSHNEKKDLKAHLLYMEQNRVEQMNELHQVFRAKFHAQSLKYQQELKKIKKQSTARQLKKHYEKELFALKEQHNNEIQQVQGQLSRENQVFQETLNQKKDLYEKQQDELKNQYENKIQNLKKEHLSAVQKLEQSLQTEKNNNEKELSSLKESYETKVQSYKDNFDQLKIKHQKRQSETASLERQLAEYQSQVKDLSHTHKIQTDILMNRHKQEIADLTAQHLEDRIEIRSQSDIKINELKTNFHAEKLEWVKEQDQKDIRVKSMHENQINELNHSFNKTLSDLKARNDSAQNLIKKQYQKDLKEATYELTSQMSETQEQYKTSLSELEESHSKRITELKDAHESQMQYITKEFEKNLIKEKQKNEELIQLYDKDTSEMRSHLLSVKSKFQSQEMDLKQFKEESQVLSKRTRILLEENKTLQSQNKTLQEVFGEVQSQLEQKIQQIQSLQKLNQHISLSLFKAQKKKSEAGHSSSHSLENSKKKSSNQNQETMDNVDDDKETRLRSELHLY